MQCGSHRAVKEYLLISSQIKQKFLLGQAPCVSDLLRVYEGSTAAPPTN